MKGSMSKQLTCQLYIGGVPIEQIPAEERKAFAKEAAEKLGRILDEIGVHDGRAMQRL